MRKTFAAAAVLLLLLTFTAQAAGEYTVVKKLNTSEQYGVYDSLYGIEDPSCAFYNFLNDVGSVRVVDGLINVNLPGGTNYHYLHSSRGVDELHCAADGTGDALRFYVKTYASPLILTFRFDFMWDEAGYGTALTLRMWYVEDENGNYIDGGTNSVIKVPAGFSGYIVLPLDEWYGPMRNIVMTDDNCKLGRNAFATMYHYVFFFVCPEGRSEFSGETYSFGEMDLIDYTVDDVTLKLAALPTELPSSAPTPTPTPSSLPSHYTADPGEATLPPSDGEGHVIVYVCIAAAVLLAAAAVLIIKKKKQV